MKSRTDAEQVAYNNVPNDLSYKPQSSVLAVACFDGYIILPWPLPTFHPTSYLLFLIYSCIHIHPCLARNARFALRVASDLPHQKTGAFAWGAGNMLFASSEAPDPIPCQHLAFDISTKKVSYKLASTECGDALVLDPQREFYHHDILHSMMLN